MKACRFLLAAGGNKEEKAIMLLEKGKRKSNANQHCASFFSLQIDYHEHFSFIIYPNK